MTKKPKKIALANDCKTTGFVTADKFLSTVEDIGVTQKFCTSSTNDLNFSRSRHTTSSKLSPNSIQRKNSRDNPKEVQTSTKISKQVQIKTPPQNLYLCIINHLKSGLRPSKICDKLGVSKSALQYHLNKLKDQGVIHKVGYGVWEVLDQPETTKKRSTNSSYVGKKRSTKEVQKNIFEFIPDSVRGHAFTFRLKVPKDMKNWTNEKREQYLDTRDPPIPYIQLGIRGGGQRLMINGRKTWLTNSSIVVYDTGSYFSETAIEAKGAAIHNFLKIIKKLERMLHTEFRIGSDYKFRVSRQHFALLKNALAQQCISEGKKLEVRSEGDNSLWFLIDDSSLDGIRFNEAETVHPSTAMTDNKKIQDWFNSLKEHPITADFILEAFALSVKNQANLQGTQMAWAENIDTHMDVLRGIGAGIQIFGDKMQTFDDKVQTMNELLQKFADLIKK